MAETFRMKPAMFYVPQGIIDIIFVIGVNPMSQSSQSMLYNPMLRMCQNIPGTPSLSGSVGAGFPGGFPMYNQYLYHYCFMDPEEVGTKIFIPLFTLISCCFYCNKAVMSDSFSVGSWVCFGPAGGFGSVSFCLLCVQDAQQDLAPREIEYLVGRGSGPDGRGAYSAGLGEFVSQCYLMLYFFIIIRKIHLESKN